MKYLIKLSTLVISLSIGMTFWKNGWPTSQAIGISVICWFLIVVIYTIAVPYLPICLQRPFYQQWKKILEAKTKEISPLVSYPFLIWMETTLDQEFEKGGMKQAKLALNQFLDERCGNVD